MDSLEKIYLVSKIAVAILLTAALYQYATTETPYKVVEWAEKGSLIRVNQETGDTQILIDDRTTLEGIKWKDIGH